MPKGCKPLSRQASHWNEGPAMVEGVVLGLACFDQEVNRDGGIPQRRHAIVSRFPHVVSDSTTFSACSLG